VKLFREVLADRFSGEAHGREDEPSVNNALPNRRQQQALAALSRRADGPAPSLPVGEPVRNSRASVLGVEPEFGFVAFRAYDLELIDGSRMDDAMNGGDTLQTTNGAMTNPSLE
jgi:hypothetical protein